jgi:hypothetical protein
MPYKVVFKARWAGKNSLKRGFAKLNHTIVKALKGAERMPFWRGEHATQRTKSAAPGLLIPL